MNRKQRRVIWAAIAVLFLALLVPPWEYSHGVLWGYAPLFSTTVDAGAGSRVWWGFLLERVSGLRVSLGLLLVEALFIVLTAAGAVVALGERSSVEANEPAQRPSTARRRARVLGWVLAGALAAVGLTVAIEGDRTFLMQVVKLGGLLAVAVIFARLGMLAWQGFVKYLIDR